MEEPYRPYIPEKMEERRRQQAIVPVFQPSHDEAGEEGAERNPVRRDDEMHRCEYQIHDRNRGVRAELFRKTPAGASRGKKFLL